MRQSLLEQDRLGTNPNPPIDRFHLLPSCSNTQGLLLQNHLNRQVQPLLRVRVLVRLSNSCAGCRKARIKVVMFL
jgi:hypothetical protein